MTLWKYRKEKVIVIRGSGNWIWWKGWKDGKKEVKDL